MDRTADTTTWKPDEATHRKHVDSNGRTIHVYASKIDQITATYECPVCESEWVWSRGVGKIDYAEAAYAARALLVGG